MSLAELELSVRATNCLESEGITTVRHLVSRTEDQLLTVRNFGETTLKEVRAKLHEIGLDLGMNVPQPRESETLPEDRSGDLRDFEMESCLTAVEGQAGRQNIGETNSRKSKNLGWRCRKLIGLANPLKSRPFSRGETRP